MTLEIPVAFFAGIIALIFWIIISCVTKQIRSKKILISLFILYMTVVVSITIFPIIIDSDLMPINDSSIILVPFSTITNLLENATLWTIVLQIIGNIIMTIPYGIFIPFMVKKKRWYNYLVYTLIFPLAIELTQLIICVSTNSFYRTVDIDDVILNSIGIIIGYGIYKILPKFIIERRKNYKTKMTYSKTGKSFLIFERLFNGFQRFDHIYFLHLAIHYDIYDC